MLVERLKVRATNDQGRTVIELVPGIEHRSLPSCSRNAPDTHKNIHVVHDFRSETTQVSTPTLSWSAGAVRDMACIRKQGVRKAFLYDTGLSSCRVYSPIFSLFSL